MSCGNPECGYRLGNEWIEDLDVLVAETLTLSWQCVLAAYKASQILGCIQSRVGSRSRDAILPLCSGETPPGVLHPALSFQHETDMDLLEQIQS